MANKVELNTLTSVVNNEKNFLVALNENLTRIQQAINDTISRSGKSPNYLESVVDMNGQRIINVGTPLTELDAVRKKDIQDLIDDANAAIVKLGQLVQEAQQSLDIYGKQVVAQAVEAKDAAVEAKEDAEAAAASLGSDIDYQKTTLYLKNSSGAVISQAEIPNSSNTYFALTAEQEAILLSTGKFLGNDVTDGSIFLTATGNFKRFNRSETEPVTFTLTEISYSKSETDTALATKQDNLIAGEGITISGDNTIAAEVDHIKNSNTSGSIEDVAVWQGSLTEFNNQKKAAYAWTRSSDLNVHLFTTSNMGSVPSRNYGINRIVPYGDHYIGIQSGSNANAIYEFDKDLLYIKTHIFPCGNFTGIYKNGDNYIVSGMTYWYTSTDLDNWTSLGTGSSARMSYFFKGTLVETPDLGANGDIVYSKDMGQTWTTLTGVVSANTQKFFEINNKLFAYSSASNVTYVTDDCETWTACNIRVMPDCYVEGTYYGNVGAEVYTSTDGITWTDAGKTVLSNYNYQPLGYVNGKFYTWSTSTVKSSTDLETWESISDSAPQFALLNVGTFDILRSSVDTTNYTLTWHGIDNLSRAYTYESNPTTASTVYDVAGDKQSLTITSVGTDTITLSDGNTYSKNADCNRNMLTTLDVTDPDKIAVINGIGIRQSGSYIRPIIPKLTATTKAEVIASGTINTFAVDNGASLIDENNKSCVLLKYTDSTAYTPFSVPTSLNRLIAYGNGVYVALVNGGTSGAEYHSYYSFDGLSWKESDNTMTGVGAAVIYNSDDNIFVAITYGGTTGYCLAYKSSNGITWELAGTIPGSYRWCDTLAYKDGVYVCGSDSNNFKNVVYSTDLVTWTTADVTVVRSFVYANNNVFVSFFTGNRYYRYSSDGITWSQASSGTLPFSDIGSISDSTFAAGNYIYIVNTTRTTLWYSSDAVTWTSTTDLVPFSILYRDGTYYAQVAGVGTYTSTTGIDNWTLAYPDTNLRYYSYPYEAVSDDRLVAANKTLVFGKGTVNELYYGNNYSDYSKGVYNYNDGSALKLWSGTQDAYDALTTKDSNTWYGITEE